MAVWLRSTTDNCTALVLCITVVLSGLSSTLGAPTNSEAGWWVNPCSKQPPLRHGRSPAENQLRIFINYIDSKFIKELKTLYNAPQNTATKVNCLKVNPMLKPIKTASTKTLATQAFYETLLQFAVFIDKLKDLPIKTNGEFNHSKRKYIFEEAKEKLKTGYL
ncbi:hypothetical protein NQ318_023412 [Aromia moschata]|uniref:Uncharacterized protein n=1 Tax=Aromia moschata TaxID=1265417 RepID=A0AAV8YST3_9CUCU|nr:hypothetical protein NQ318_023412 [Aromia moschata]